MFDVFWSNVCCDMYVDIFIYIYIHIDTHIHTYMLVMVCAWVMHAWELKAPTR